MPEQLLVAQRHPAHAVKRRNGFVVEVADEAAVRQRQMRILQRRTEPLHIRLDGIDRCPIDAFHEVVFLDHQLVPKYLQPRKRLSADEGKPAELLLRRIDGFKDEAFFLVDELIVDRHRRIEIHIDFRRHGDEVVVL